MTPNDQDQDRTASPEPETEAKPQEETGDNKRLISKINKDTPAKLNRITNYLKPTQKYNHDKPPMIPGELRGVENNHPGGYTGDERQLEGDHDHGITKGNKKGLKETLYTPGLNPVLKNLSNINYLEVQGKVEDKEDRHHEKEEKERGTLEETKPSSQGEKGDNMKPDRGENQKLKEDARNKKTEVSRIKKEAHHDKSKETGGKRTPGRGHWKEKARKEKEKKLFKGSIDKFLMPLNPNPRTLKLNNENGGNFNLHKGITVDKEKGSQMERESSDRPRSLSQLPNSNQREQSTTEEEARDRRSKGHNQRSETQLTLKDLWNIDK